MFTQEELSYYSRQLSLPEFGVVEQLKLKESKVLVAGAGGLGCPVLQYLAGAGIGNIIIVDGDIVQINNLHRQILFDMSDLGINKAIAAQEKLCKLNPHIQVEAIPVHISAENIPSMLEKADLVIDATDNFEARSLLGYYTFNMKKPLVYAGIFGFEGQLTVFNFKNGPSFHDLFPEIPKIDSLINCAVNGVLGFVPGFMGCLQASEAIKVITGIGEVMSGKLLLVNLLSLSIKVLAIKSSDHNTMLNFKIEKMIREINLSELNERLESVFLLDVREQYEFDNYNIGGKLIPLSELPDRLAEIPDDKDFVIVCESGIRSMHAAQYLSRIYVNKNIYNLKGGLKVLKH